MERLLDEGGMASIYLAQDIQTRIAVAIKCLYRIYTKSEIVRARFIDEGRIQMMLQHPNVVRVHQFVEQPTLAFVMEYVHGPTLEDLLADRGMMGITEVLEIMVPVLSALGLAHSRHIVHRDLKPSNILLHDIGGEWHPKVMDFGVAKLRRTKALTATGTTVGTLHYMSPEQIVGSKHIDGRADIYSLGITLYKLCTGDVPFNAATEFALMMAQVEATPQPPSQINPSISPEFEQVILKALEKKPEARYQNIKEFTSALLSLRDEHGKETMDTINIPSFLLDYAMMADQVAVDRTEEIMVRSRTLESASPSLDSSQTQEHVRRTLPLPQEEEDENASTIEIDSLRLDHFSDHDKGNNTLDMSLDTTAQSRISSTAFEQLVRESEARELASRSAQSPSITHDDTSSRDWSAATQISEMLERTDEDRTIPMRVKTSDGETDAYTRPLLSSSSRASHRPPSRHTPSSGEPHFGLPHAPISSIPPFASSKHLFDLDSAEPLPPRQTRRSVIEGAPSVDTGERTMPFNPPSASERGLRETSESGEHFAPTITADRLLAPEAVAQSSAQATKDHRLIYGMIAVACVFVFVFGVILAVWALLS